MKFLLATNNPGKLAEMRELMSDFEIVSPGDLGLDLDVDETGAAFRDNAFLKARAFCEASGLPSIADDSGLCVDALGGAPGVHSRRWAGEDVPLEELADHMLRRMENEDNRACKFVSHIACAFPNGDIIDGYGECRGEITRERRGEDGFAYDPVFYVPEFGRTMAEMSIAEKNAVSHRGRAIRDLIEKLDDNFAFDGIGDN